MSTRKIVMRKVNNTSVLKNLRQMSKHLCQVTPTADRHSSPLRETDRYLPLYICVRGDAGYVHGYAGGCVHIKMEIKGQP